MPDPDAPMSSHEKFRFSDGQSLLAKAAELGVELPFQDDISPLLEPIEIQGHRLPNRCAVLPMEGCDGEPDGAPGELTFRRYRRFGAGGAGLIWFEATAVAPEGRANPRQLRICKNTLGSFGRLVADTRSAAKRTHGNDAAPLLILQLTHSGRYVRPDGTPGPIIAHRSHVLDPEGGIASDQALISDDELDRLQTVYIDAARLAHEVGFDGVDIKACHGYLVSELLASHTRNESRYGGSFENRTRFLRETVKRIGEELPGMIPTSRISAFDAIPHPYGFGVDGGEKPAAKLDEPIALARELLALGCPLLNISIGNPYHEPHYGRPFDKPVAGAVKPPENPLVGVGRFLSITAELQHGVPSLPIVGVGFSWLRHFAPHVAAAAISRGDAAFFGLGRGAFAYPDFVNDLTVKGRLDREKTCIACSGCSQIMRDGGCAGCIVRDSDVYAEQYRQGRQRLLDLNDSSTR